MYFTPEIYDPKTGLDVIDVAIAKFNPERFLYALEYKNCDETEMELMARHVAEYRAKHETEYTRLLKF